MKHLLLATGLLLAAPAVAQTKKAATTSKAKPPIVRGVLALDTKNGFRNYTFGTPITSIKGLREFDAPGLEGNLYEKPGEYMGIGPVHLSSLRFISKRGRLIGFMLGCFGEENKANLLAVLKEKYGLGLVYPDGHVSWPGNRVGMDYVLSPDGGCTVTILSVSGVEGQTDTSLKRQIKRGTNDL